jgi:hypothetical protein
LMEWLCITAPAPRSSYACRAAGGLGASKAAQAVQAGQAQRPAVAGALVHRQHHCQHPVATGTPPADTAGKKMPCAALRCSLPPTQLRVQAARGAAGAAHRHEQRRALAQLGGLVGRWPGLGLLHHVALAVQDVHVSGQHPLLLHAGRRHDDAIARHHGDASAGAAHPSLVVEEAAELADEVLGLLHLDRHGRELHGLQGEREAMDLRVLSWPPGFQEARRGEGSEGSARGGWRDGQRPGGGEGRTCDAGHPCDAGALLCGHNLGDDSRLLFCRMRGDDRQCGGIPILCIVVQPSRSSRRSRTHYPRHAMDAMVVARGEGVAPSCSTSDATVDDTSRAASSGKALKHRAAQARSVGARRGSTPAAAARDDPCMSIHQWRAVHPQSAVSATCRWARRLSTARALS